ncbi:MAG TPA: cell wall hydrolase [Hyphomicrobiaceae bacterium]|nr:cell wall hydrolase [Hyphomicrobiaceae bacterium]
MKEIGVRVQFSLVTLILAATATPGHASLGSAPTCVPLTPAEHISIKLPLRDRAHANDIDADERDYLIRTMVFEAGTEPDEGKAAVAHTVLNRVRSGRWGNSIGEVVTARWQFEPWMMKRNEVEALSKSDPRYRDAARIADAVLSGEIADPTAGATHFLNPTIVKQRRGGSLPDWASGEGKPIGRHTFYRPDEGTPMLDFLVVSTEMFGNDLSCSPQEQQAEDDYVDWTPLA